MKRMSKVMRAGAAAILALGGLAATAASASAQVDPCDPTSEDYVPGEVCEIEIEFEPSCDQYGVPAIRYDATLTGGTAPSLDITWVNPTGPDVVVTDQPLSGTAVWPGTVIGADGKAKDWPGWTKTSTGAWVKGDAYDWTRPSVEVVFAANPEATIVAVYPDAPQCNPTSQVVQVGNEVQNTGQLSSTGFDGAPLAGLAAGLVVGGGIALAIGRARRHQS